MRIRKAYNQFSPTPLDLVSSSFQPPDPPSTMLTVSNSISSNQNQEQNSRAVGNGEKSNGNCSSSGSSTETSSASSSIYEFLGIDQIPLKKRKVEVESEQENENEEEKEKSKCTRKKGTGWRCSNEREKGHSLCCHDMDQSRHWKRQNIQSAGNCFGVGKKKQRMMMITTILNKTVPLLTVNPNP